MVEPTAVTLTNDEIQEFESMYSEILEAVIKDYENSKDQLYLATDWMVKAINYNVPKGKKLRGLMVPITYRNFVKNPTKEEMRMAYVLGWCIEILQGACLVADDIMDKSETRRGQPCWYKLEDVGLMAVNDTFMLENLAYKVLKLYVSKEPYYMEVLEITHEITLKTILGQCMDCHMENSDDILESFTMDRYSSIVKYKTSYYTMYLPVLFGMIMAGRGRDQKSIQKVEEIMLDIGHYFQVQDDFLDCFGNEDVTGKIGTDIQDSKCSWLFIQAVQKCNDKELECLLNNYGCNERGKIERVKRLYKDLELENVFREYENNVYLEIVDKIQKLPVELPGKLFEMLLLKIFQRQN
ncbi:unnamed protein product [Orchesella dallaii]